jgi:hypothetical protein
VLTPRIHRAGAGDTGASFGNTGPRAGHKEEAAEETGGRSWAGAEAEFSGKVWRYKGREKGYRVLPGNTAGAGGTRIGAEAGAGYARVGAGYTVAGSRDTIAGAGDTEHRNKGAEERRNKKKGEEEKGRTWLCILVHGG